MGTYRLWGVAEPLEKRPKNEARCSYRREVDPGGVERSKAFMLMGGFAGHYLGVYFAPVYLLVVCEPSRFARGLVGAKHVNQSS